MEFQLFYFRFTGAHSRNFRLNANSNILVVRFMGNKKTSSIYELCPYLCGILYSIFASMACAMLTEALIRFGTSNPFLTEHAVTVVMGLLLFMMIALTAVFNVYIFKKVNISISNALFEILFPLLTAIPLLYFWSSRVSFLEWARWIISIFS